jgi:hypothetical protein
MTWAAQMEVRRAGRVDAIRTQDKSIAIYVEGDDCTYQG